MKLYIKNMVCNRCKTVVKAELEKAGLQVRQVELGEIEIAEEVLSGQQLDAVKQAMSTHGFELIDDHKSKIIERIKNHVIDIVHHSEEPTNLKHSQYLAQQLGYDYTYLSRLFSEVEGITIEQYFISQRIERAKELLIYDELSLTEIADKLYYSSVAHLSSQFKKITGMTPSQFKNLRNKNRKPLDEVGH